VHAAALCGFIALVCSCAAATPPKEPGICLVRATFRGHLAAVRGCEEKGLFPTPEIARASGANLALAFAPSWGKPPAGDEVVGPDREEPAWISFNPGGLSLAAGYRAFRCPPAFMEEVERSLGRPCSRPK
jgi:hypothetical protein